MGLQGKAMKRTLEELDSLFSEERLDVFDKKTDSSKCFEPMRPPLDDITESLCSIGRISPKTQPGFPFIKYLVRVY